MKYLLLLLLLLIPISASAQFQLTSDYLRTTSRWIAVKSCTHLEDGICTDTTTETIPVLQGGGQQGGYPAYRFRRLTAEPATCLPGDVYFNINTGKNRQCLTTNTWSDFGSGSGSGSVTLVSVTTANGVSGSVANPTTTPAITLTLGAITPSSVAASGTVTGSNLSGTNTGDQTISLTGDVTGSGTGSFAATIANLAVTNAKIANATIDLTTKPTGILPVANGGTGANTLTANNVILGNGASAVAFVAPSTSGNVLTSNGTTWTSAAATGGSVGSGNVNMTVANASSTGTAVNRLAKLTGAPSTAVIAATSDTENAVGVCTGGCGTTGNATLAIMGQVSCDFDGATTAGNYVVISSTTAGKCHDGGSSFPNAQAAYGRVLSTNGAQGTYAMELMTPDIAFQNAGNGKSRPASPTQFFQYNNGGSFDVGDLAMVSAGKVILRTNGGSGVGSTQNFYVARQYVSDSNFHGLRLGCNNSTCDMAVSDQGGSLTGVNMNIGTGSSASIFFYAGGSQRWSVDSGGDFIPSGSDGGFNLASSAKRANNVYYAGQLTPTQGSLNASLPFITHTATWTNSGVTYQNILSNVTNTNSAAASTLIDLQVGSATQFKVDKAGNTTHAGSITIGGGTAILKHLSATATLDFGNLVSIGCEDLTITVTGAALGDTVTLGIPNGSVPDANFYYPTPWVSSSNTVTVRGCTLVSGNPASGTFRVDVWQH